MSVPDAKQQPVPGAGTTYFIPFPILGLASNGSDIFCTSGGGGSTSVKEVPNQVHAHRYCEATKKLSTVAALNTGTNLVVNLSYSPVTNLWLASSRTGTKMLSLDIQGNALTEVCEFQTESEGKEPEQNFATYSPDGSLIVTGGTDGQVKLWNAGTPPTLLRNCGSKTKEILDGAFSDDRSYVATCDGTGCCTVFEVANEDKPEGTNLTYMSKKAKGKVLVKQVRFLSHRPTPTLLLAANGIQRGMNYGVVGFMTLTGELLTEVVADQGPLKSVAISSNEQCLCVGLMAGKKVILKLPELKQLEKTKELHSLPAQCVAFVGGSTAISVSGDRDVHLLAIRSSSSSSFGMIVQVILVLIIVVYILYRIGTIGAFVEQGKIEL